MSPETSLATYDRAKYNVLLPTPSLVAQIGQWHALRVNEVTISADPNTGDVYKVGSRLEGGRWVDVLAPAKPALMRIASAAGIVWHWRESGPTSVSRDYVLYKAVGAVRLPDGSWQPIMAYKEIDLTVIEEELTEQWTEKADALVSRGGLPRDEQTRYKHEWRKVATTDRDTGAGETRNVCFLDPSEAPRYIDDHVRAALIQWRKNKLQRAETGAMMRVIRAALGIRASYTPAELARTFIVPRIDFTPDYSDPEVRRALTERGAAAMTAAFGQPAEAEATPAALPGGPPAPAAASEAVQPPIVAAEDETAEDTSPAGDVPAGVDPETGEVLGEPAAPPAPPEFTCAVCGLAVSKQVAGYSAKAFGKVLCFRDQPRQAKPTRRVRG